jgi:hypothetical protein
MQSGVFPKRRRGLVFRLTPSFPARRLISQQNYLYERIITGKCEDSIPSIRADLKSKRI